MSLAYSRKHWRQIMMLYLRMIACWLEHTRLFIKVYNKKSKNVSLVHQRKKLNRGKKEEKSIKARRVRKEGPFVVHRQSIVSVIAKSNRNYIDAHFLASYSVRTNSPRFWFIVSSPPSLVNGVSAAAEKKKKAQTRVKNLSHRIRKQNTAHVPSSTAFGVIFRVRPPHVCKAHFYA